MTFRRDLLDEALGMMSFSGDVLDVGGKKLNKRGIFRPSMEKVKSWKYLNTDPESKPDYLCSVENIPLEDETINFVILTEVLEHLKVPVSALTESHRILRQGGGLIASMPFLYPIHADPDDYQRWTQEKIRMELEGIGFFNIQVRPMGSLFAVIFDLLHHSLNRSKAGGINLKHRFMARIVMPALRTFFKRLDRHFDYLNIHITTGYFITATK